MLERVPLSATEYLCTFNVFPILRVLAFNLCFWFQDLEIHEFNWEHATLQRADSLWNTLSSLPSLTSIFFSVEFHEGKESEGISDMCSLSQLTNIR